MLGKRKRPAIFRERVTIRRWRSRCVCYRRDAAPITALALSHPTKKRLTKSLTKMCGNQADSFSDVSNATRTSDNFSFALYWKCHDSHHTVSLCRDRRDHSVGELLIRTCSAATPATSSPAHARRSESRWPITASPGIMVTDNAFTKPRICEARSESLGCGLL